MNNTPGIDEAPSGTVLIDVRSHGEYAAAHLQGALCLPLDELTTRVGSVVPDLHQAVLLYCASGMRSEMARQQMLRMGYTQVVNGGGAGQVALSLGLPVVRGH